MPRHRPRSCAAALGAPPPPAHPADACAARQAWHHNNEGHLRGVEWATKTPEVIQFYESLTHIKHKHRPKEGAAE